MSKPAILFDRDGTLSIDKGYTVRPQDLLIYPGAGLTVGRLKRAGYDVVIVTNQSAVGRGMCSEEDVISTNNECLRQLLLEDAAAKVDAVCFCPHAPEANCNCRKPRTGMLSQVGFEIDVYHSWMVGDKTLDIEFGVNAGIPVRHCVILRTGHGATEVEVVRKKWNEEVHECDDIRSVTAKILGEM